MPFINFYWEDKETTCEQKKELAARFEEVMRTDGHVMAPVEIGFIDTKFTSSRDWPVIHVFWTVGRPQEWVEAVMAGLHKELCAVLGREQSESIIFFDLTRGYVGINGAPINKKSDPANGIF